MNCVLIVRRVVKINTHVADKYAPRTSNVIKGYVSGPFASLKAARRAVAAALATHTALDAQVWTEEQIRTQHAKGYSQNGSDKYELMSEAVRLLDAVEPARAVP